MFSIYDGRAHFYQWDTERKIIVADPAITEVHFCNKTDDCSLVVETHRDDSDILVADVPNILLQNDYPIKVYAVCSDGYTRLEETFKVKTRSKPADYVYTETELKRYEYLENKVREIDEKGYSEEALERGLEDYFTDNPTIMIDDGNGNITIEAIKGADVANLVRGEGEHATKQNTGNNTASGIAATALGGNSTASGDYSFAAGSWASAKAQGAVALNAARANGLFSFATGAKTDANGERSVATGQEAVADGFAANAQNIKTQAKGMGSSAEGKETEAIGQFSHAENYKTKATGDCSHAGGQATDANKLGSFAHGLHLITGREWQTMVGQYGVTDANALFIVGAGTGQNSRKNAFTVNQNGAEVNGQLKATSLNTTSIDTGSINATAITLNGGLSANGIAGTGIYIKGTNNPNLYENTVYCVTQDNKGVIFGNTFAARKWNWQGGGWLDATLTYDDIIALKKLIGG